MVKYMYVKQRQSIAVQTVVVSLFQPRRHAKPISGASEAKRCAQRLLA